MTTEEKIIAALRENGPMTSHELCEKLGLEWTDFSVPLLKMIRNTFNPEGKVLSNRGSRGTVYSLSE